MGDTIEPQDAPATQPDTPQPPAPRGPKMGCRTVVLLFLIICSLAGMAGYWLWKSEPGYWNQRKNFLSELNVHQRMEIAQSVERRFLEAINVASNGLDHVVGASDSGEASAVSHDVLLTADEINAWLDQRLAGWAANQGIAIPDYINEPMVAINGDHLIIAFRLEHPPLSQIVSVTTSVEIQDGQAELRVEAIHGGRLRVPGVKAVSDAVHNSGSESEFASVAAKITEAFDGKVLDPVIKLNHQKIRITAIKIQPKGVRLTLKPDEPQDRLKISANAK